MEINVDDKTLEKALNEKVKHTKEPELSKEEEIGFHKGALNTLIAERNELIKMISNVEAIVQAHLKRLEELGVKIERQERR
jgi:hypothetical protein